MSDPRKLDERIDAALSAWPERRASGDARNRVATHDTEVTLDASGDAIGMAAQTMARIHAHQQGTGARTARTSGYDHALSDDQLFAPPFPEEPIRKVGDEEVTLTAPAAMHLAQARSPSASPSVSRPASRPVPAPASRPPREQFSGGGQKSTRDDVPSGRMEAISPPSSREARMTMSSEQRQRERTSFKDIAKLAATPPPSATQPTSSASNAWGSPEDAPPSSRVNPNDSGMVDLKLVAALDPKAPERAKSTPLASAGLFDEDPPAAARASAPPVSGIPASAAPISAPPVSGPVSGVAAFAPSVPALPSQGQLVAEAVPASVGAIPASLPPHSAVPVAPISARAALAGAPAKKEKKSSILPFLGGLLTLSAVAAGGVFYVRHHKAPAPAPVAAAAAPVEQPAVVAAASAPPTPAADTTQAVAANDPAAQDDTADDTAPAAGKKPTSKAGHARKGAKAAAAQDDGKVAAAAPPEAPAKAEPKVKFAPSGGGGDLANAMKAAAGPIDGPTQADDKPAAPQFAPGSVPQKPANGAVQGAIGAVLPNARACLGPDDPVSHATIVFASAGNVQSVAITGGAAGKPEEKCIKQALGRAKVQPFAEPSFTTSFTVRP